MAMMPRKIATPRSVSGSIGPTLNNRPAMSREVATATANPTMIPISASFSPCPTKKTNQSSGRPLSVVCRLLSAP
jgi:hypothetical protein